MIQIGEVDKIVNGVKMNLFDVSDESEGHPVINIVAEYQDETVEHRVTIGAAESVTPVTTEVLQAIIDAEREQLADMIVARASAKTAFGQVQ